MGGNVAWTLRLADGTEHRMNRWTNIFPETTMDDAFLAGEQAAIDEALKSWLEMKADWEANRDTGKFQHRMTEVYAPYPFGLKPFEYGFIVTDFVTKTIVSCQHYTNPTRLYVEYWMNPSYEPEFSFQKLAQALAQASDDERSAMLKHLAQVIGLPAAARAGSLSAIEETVAKQAAAEKAREEEEAQARAEQMLRLTTLHAAGRIVSFDERVGDKRVRTPADGLPLDAIIRRSLTMTTLGVLDIAPPEPWQVLTFSSDSPFGRRDAYAAVKQLGFDLSPEEIAAFEAWITDDEDEADDVA